MKKLKCFKEKPTIEVEPEKIEEINYIDYEMYENKWYRRKTKIEVLYKLDKVKPLGQKIEML